jgi:hypothetical protein
MFAGTQPLKARADNGGMQINNAAVSASHDEAHPDASSRELSSELETRAVVCEPAESTEVIHKEVALEAEILAVFAEPPVSGEPRELTFKRKEQQLAALFAQLVPAESLVLEERLRLAMPSDPIAAQFGRFVAVRRARLLAFLSASRKRHPLQLARAAVASAASVPEKVEPAGYRVRTAGTITSAGRR